VAAINQKYTPESLSHLEDRGRNGLPYGGNGVQLNQKSNPVADKTGEFSNKNQNDPYVWFLLEPFAGNAERRCTTAAGRQLS
jgi:hypothetical protein